MLTICKYIFLEQDAQTMWKTKKWNHGRRQVMLMEKMTDIKATFPKVWCPEPSLPRVLVGLNEGFVANSYWEIWG